MNDWPPLPGTDRPTSALPDPEPPDPDAPDPEPPNPAASDPDDPDEPDEPEAPPPPDPEALAELLDRQCGVVAKAQLFACGYTQGFVRARLRLEWQILHPGVYLTHTGPASPRQLEWAACLAAWPAALSHQSAVHELNLRNPGSLIHVAVPNSHRVRSLKGVRVHEMLAFRDRVHWAASPPRIKKEHAILDLARHTIDQYGTIALLGEAVQGRITTAARLARAVDDRLRVRHRDVVNGLLLDVEAGIRSALELAYAKKVERPHGLPVAKRQFHEGNRYRDAFYEDQGLIVELDGLLFHGSAQDRERDARRDLDAKARLNQDTVRLTWGQVTRTSCETAALISSLLQRRGWRGRFKRCRDCPPLAA